MNKYPARALRTARRMAAALGIAAAFGLAGTAHAEKHALIMAISAYPAPIPSLKGVPNDVDSARRIARSMGVPDKNVRKSIAMMYDTLLKDASEFDWQNYVTRLGLDGGLSDVEKRHLEIMRDLVKSQVSQLRASKDAILRIIGAMEQS